MRVLALSNEPRPGTDQDVPWALARLTRRRRVTDYAVYSVRAAVASLSTSSAAREIADTAAAMWHAFTALTQG